MSCFLQKRATNIALFLLLVLIVAYSNRRISQRPKSFTRWRFVPEVLGRYCDKKVQSFAKSFHFSISMPFIIVAFFWMVYFFALHVLRPFVRRPVAGLVIYIDIAIFFVLLIAMFSFCCARIAAVCQTGWSISCVQKYSRTNEESGYRCLLERVHRSLKYGYLLAWHCIVFFTPNDNSHVKLGLCPPGLSEWLLSSPCMILVFPRIFKYACTENLVWL